MSCWRESGRGAARTKVEGRWTPPGDPGGFTLLAHKETAGNGVGAGRIIYIHTHIHTGNRTNQRKEGQSGDRSYISSCLPFCFYTRCTPLYTVIIIVHALLQTAASPFGAPHHPVMYHVLIESVHNPPTQTNTTSIYKYDAQ